MRTLYLSLLPFALLAEDRTITLKEAVSLALKQNPDVVLARLDEQRVALGIRVAKDPFFPKVFVGSGLAYTNGFPMSIEGSAPSIVQGRAVASILNRAYSYRAAQAAQDARTAAIDTQIRQRDVAQQTAIVYLDAMRWSRAAQALRQQIRSLEQADEAMKVRVSLGRELEIEGKRTALAVARARQRMDLASREGDFAESSLAILIGMSPADRARPESDPDAATSVTGSIDAPADEAAAIAGALSQSRELRRLESAIVAKELESKQHRAARLPTLDLVAQYGLFAKYNNFEDFFQKFQRHNGQLGVSVQVPLLPPTASDAQAAQVAVEITRLKSQVIQTRNRISLDVQRSFQNVKTLEQSREIARLTLDLARDQVGVFLAQHEAGRASLKQLEEARAAEHDRWLEYYDAQFSLERAKVELLSHTGVLLASLR